MSQQLREEIAAAAARLVVEDGMEYGPAKRRAARDLAGSRRIDLPDNDLVEEAVREYLAIFCADTQPGELAALRELAAVWMARLAEFRPYLTGAVWRGTATRLSAVHLQLYCDDAKAAELALINQNVQYEVASHTDARGRDINMLALQVRCAALGELVPLRLSVLDHDDLRGALKPDPQGRSQRGDLAALQRLMQDRPAADKESTT
jgi:hypothetical protein